MSIDIKVGDEVALKVGVWHQNEDVGNRLAVVVNITGHILVDVCEFHNNPVKCFRSDIEAVIRGGRLIYEDFPDEVVEVVV